MICSFLIGANCSSANSIIPAVAGSQWSVSGGAWALIGCPPGYSLATQMCSLCPAKWYCPGYSNPAASCGESLFSLPGAVSPASCFPVVYTILTSLVWRSITDNAAVLLQSAMAEILELQPGYVFLASVSQPVSATPNVVTIYIASQNAEAAGMLAQPIVSDALTKGLALYGFPDTTFISIGVTACIPGYALVTSVCQPCAVGYYCVGGTEPSKGCDVGFFSFSKANSSSSCWAADFLILEAVMSSSDFKGKFPNDTIDEKFQLVLAKVAQVPPDIVVVNSMTEFTTRRSEQTTLNAGIAILPNTGPEVAQRIQSNLNTQLQMEGLPTATIASLTITGDHVSAVVGSSVSLIVGLVIACCITVCMVGSCLCTNSKSASQEEKLLQSKMEELREKFGITMRDGFVLSSETRQWRCTKARAWADMTVVRRSYLEAAARLALLEVHPSLPVSPQLPASVEEQ